MKNKLSILSIAVLAAGFLFTGCKKEKEPTITVTNFTASIAENPSMGQSIGFVNATIENGNYTRYYFNPEHTGIGGHVSMNGSTGEMTVSNPGFFDFEQVTSITGTAEISTTDDNDNETIASFTVTINLTDVVETQPAPALTIQERLDSTETPIQIYNSDNTLLDSLYGKSYAGGLIYYLNTTTGAGYVAATADQSTGIEWDPNTTGLLATGATGNTLGDGMPNTSTIVSSIGAGNYAAQACNDLTLNSYSDWFLPSLEELTGMYLNLHAKGFGNFLNMRYWASNEIDVNNAWYRDFSISSGQVAGTIGKYNLYAVRAARAF